MKTFRYLVLFALLIGPSLFIYSNRERVSECQSSGLSESSSFSEFFLTRDTAPGESLSKPLYQLLVRGGYRRPTFRIVRILEHVRSAESEGVFEDPCKQLRFLAELISRLSQGGAAVIVIPDPVPENCTQERNRFVHLLLDIREKTPIVVGRKLDSNCNLKSDIFGEVWPRFGGLLGHTPPRRRIPLQFWVSEKRSGT